VKTTRGWLLLIGIELVAACACLGILGVLVSTGDLAATLQSAQALRSSTPPAPSRTPTVTQPPTATETPAPTYTLVIPPLPADFTPPPLVYVSRTPTREPVPYDVVIPTPTAPAMVYPIKLDSSLKVVTYGVIGKTVNDILQSLNAQAMPDSNDPNGEFLARTDYFISAQWSYQPTARGCEVESGTVTLAMTMTLPALSSTVGMPPDLLNRWTTFISNTITHESGHVKLNYQGASDFQRDLGNALPASDCTTIEPRLNDLFTRATGAIRQSNIDYDAETEHGAKQGAVFP
jgi:predicted secreted Zn-dependent protease